MSTEYNGWTNYETWTVNLYLDNDEGTQALWREHARACLDGSDKAAAGVALASLLEDTYTEAQPELTGMYADLLAAAFSAVNWREIADNLITSLD